MVDSVLQARRWRAAVLVLVVVAGVAANLATTVAPTCDESAPYQVTVIGDGQTGAATAPLGRRLEVAVSCRATPGGGPLTAFGDPVTWTVETGGGLVDGVVERTKPTGFDGTAGVTWTLGPEIGEQTVSVVARGQRRVLRASAGGPTSGGTCTGGAGTDLDEVRLVEGDEHWPLAGSPYRGAVLRVAAGGRLAIAPGVTVCLRDLAVDAAGQLLAEGEPGQPVQMAPSLQSGGYWWARLDGWPYGPEPELRQNVLRHVNVRNLTSLQVEQAPLRLEDSRFTVDVAGAAGATVRWAVAPAAAGTESAARRVVFEGYGVPPDIGRAPALGVVMPAFAASASLPFQVRVLRSRSHALQVSGDGSSGVALEGCEISDSAGMGLIVHGTGAPVTVNGCNLSGNAEFAVFNGVDGRPPIDARGNWWGDPAGAPTAGGNAVTAGVDAANPAAAPFVLGY